MEKINLTQNDINSFELLTDNSSESILYLHNNKVYKIFRTNDNNKSKDGITYTKEQLENKRKKILLLNNMDLSKNFTKPIELLYIDNNFVGYTMNYIKSTNLDNMKLEQNNDIKLEILAKTKELVTEAHKNGIILSDLNPNNFLVTNNDVFVCDLDNCSIGNYKSDYINKNIGGKYVAYHDINEGLDWFLFNLLVISIMTNTLFNCIYGFNSFTENKIFHKEWFEKFYEKFIKISSDNYEVDDVLNLFIKHKHEKNFLFFK